MGSASQYPVGGPGRDVGRRRALALVTASGQRARRQAPPRLALLAKGSPGNAFRATRLAVRNCKDGIDGEQEIGVHGKDHEDFTRSSKRRVHPKDRKKFLQADPGDHRTRGLRLCRTHYCLSDARAAARGSAAANRFPSD